MISRFGNVYNKKNFLIFRGPAGQTVGGEVISKGCFPCCYVYCCFYYSAPTIDLIMLLLVPSAVADEAPTVYSFETVELIRSYYHTLIAGCQKMIYYCSMQSPFFF